MARVKLVPPERLDPADRLVTESHVRAVADRSADGVHVGRADQRRGGADEGVVGTRLRARLVDECHLSDAAHRERLHRSEVRPRGGFFVVEPH